MIKVLNQTGAERAEYTFSELMGTASYRPGYRVTLEA